MRLIVSLLLILSAQLILSAEAKAQITEYACPSVRIEYKVKNPLGAGISDNGACPGAEATFTATVSGIASQEAPKFNWTLNAGEILSGQGTSTIIVSTKGADKWPVIATVEVTGEGFKPDCKGMASATLLTATCCLPPCPTISMSCPTDQVAPGTPATVSVNLSGGDPNASVTYNWTVSAGTISSGQGSPTITVDTTSAAGQTITATVEIGGLAPECDRVRSCSMSSMPFDPGPPAEKFDEYSDISRANEESRLANFGRQLQNEPGASAYIIIYGPRGVSQYLERIRKLLIKNYEIIPDRITSINGGYNQKTKVELWLAPVGAAAPQPNPRF